ncbi:hypothetical protein BIFGAL_03315 [Bifidobacterium gallicum DSM 20093 = LMG 11596]|uniref:Uncharacterized protein n=1 Tax=Bifidobacterium gallicum DSM 20093 = LMG 11596 TaxID=561180 RepID=D1NTZ3_9BIFI|nr:hypothetical protein BIFGAL_03315 [Bifidobacterium gallicum DSM 20093 = LMG 11596]
MQLRKEPTLVNNETRRRDTTSDGDVGEREGRARWANETGGKYHVSDEPRLSVRQSQLFRLFKRR